MEIRKTGLILLLLPVMLSLLFLFLPYKYSSINLEERLLPPSISHPFGTDSLGRDLAKRTAIATFISVSIAIIVVLITSSMGTLLGMFSGYTGGFVDELVMRTVDLLLAFPGFLLALAIVALMGGGYWNLVFALSFTGWTSYARLARGEAIKLREEDFVKSTRVLGGSHLWILRHHLFPHILPLIRIQAVLSVAGVILAESSLSFLGLGLQPPTPSLGGMIDEGRAFLFEAPWISVFPGLFLFCLIMGLLLTVEKKNSQSLIS